MKDLDDKQKRKLLAAAEIVDRGDLAVLSKILEFEDFLEKYQADKEGMDTVLSRLEEVKSLCADSDNKIIAEVNKVLASLEISLTARITVSQGTSAEQFATLKASLATQLEEIRASVPSMPDLSFYADRLIEIEQKIPEIKETVLDTPIELRDKLEALNDDERLDRSAVKGLELYVEQPVLDRAIEILDRRTQFLISKQGGGTSSGITGLISPGTNVTITGTGTSVAPYVINSTGGTGTPGGLNTQLQYNNSGAFGGISRVTTDGSDLILTGQSPSYAQGKLAYDTDNESLTFYNNDSSISLQIGQEEWIRVKNVTGSTIPNGSSVYISGANAGLPTIALAQANAATTTIGAGLTTESIANNAIGYVTSIGVVHGLDTSAFTAGATVFISATVAGGLTATAPTAPNYRYRIGIVAVSSATVGSIHVTPSTAALGNGTANQVFGINAAGSAQEVKSILGTANRLTATNAANSITFDVSATFEALLGKVASPLSQFASTTSAQLAGIVSDETGTGALVFGTSPVLTTPNIGIATGTNVIMTANAITASANAATVPVTSGRNIVTNNSAAALTITMATSGAVSMQTCVVQVLPSSAVAQTLTFVNTENSVITSVPANTGSSTTIPITVGFFYNASTSKWTCAASS